MHRLVQLKNKQKKTTKQLHTEEDIASLEFPSSAERRHYDADQLGRAGVEHARNSPETEFGKIHTRNKFLAYRTYFDIPRRLLEPWRRITGSTTPWLINRTKR
jgi:hypothetical protein